MTLTHFQLLPPVSQLAWVMTQGIYLAHRWENELAVTLFYVADGQRGFLAEVGVTQAQNAFMVRRSFNAYDLLDANPAQFPEWSQPDEPKVKTTPEPAKGFIDLKKSQALA